jgi:beta-phosphoglucomutase
MKTKISLKEYEAVFFDLDGTLIDSMHHHYKCWTKILTIYNSKISKNDFFLNEGKNIYELMKIWTGINDLSKIKELISVKDKIFNQSYCFKLFEGVEDLLSLIEKKNIVRGLVTASTQERYETTCPKWFQDYFSVIVTSEDGGRGKPYPDPYNIAALKALVKPDKCLVIENSPYGIDSANDAGMASVGVAHTVQVKNLNHAKYVYKSIYEFYGELISENK